MFCHAFSFCASGARNYAEQKQAATLPADKLDILVLGRSVFIVRGKVLVAALDDPRRAKETERQIHKLGGKKNEAFSFSEVRWETRGEPSLLDAPRKKGLWLVHAAAMPCFNRMLERHGMTPFMNQVFQTWTFPKNDRRPLVAVATGASVLVSGTDVDLVKKIAVSVGITRDPEHLAVAKALSREILRRRDWLSDPLLS